MTPSKSPSLSDRPEGNPSPWLRVIHFFLKLNCLSQAAVRATSASTVGTGFIGDHQKFCVRNTDYHSCQRKTLGGGGSRFHSSPSVRPHRAWGPQSSGEGTGDRSRKRGASALLKVGSQIRRCTSCCFLHTCRRARRLGLVWNHKEASGKECRVEFPQAVFKKSGVGWGGGDASSPHWKKKSILANE